jgi:hypothetical protein
MCVSNKNRGTYNFIKEVTRKGKNFIEEKENIPHERYS